MIFEGWTSVHYMIVMINSNLNGHTDDNKSRMLEALRDVAKMSRADFAKVLKEVEDMKASFYATKAALRNMRKP